MLAVLVAAISSITAGVVVNDAADSRQSYLETSGLQYAGVVDGVNYDPKGPDPVVVSFERGGRTDTAHLNGDDLQSGDKVTVLVDPDDPDRISLGGHRQQSALAYGSGLVLLVTGVFVLLPVGCLLTVQAVRRRRRRRRRRRTKARRQFAATDEGRSS